MREVLSRGGRLLPFLIVMRKIMELIKRRSIEDRDFLPKSGAYYEEGSA